MHLRIVLARFILKLGAFIQSASLMVMRPDDLIEFSRQTYSRDTVVANWSTEEILETGLNAGEEELLAKISDKKGRLLLLGIGGGREAIPLARSGFQVTGVDFIPEMVEKAKQNAARYGLQIDGVVQEISRLDFAEGSYDVVWLSAVMYSCIPTRKKRIAMLRSISRILPSQGYFVCQFFWDPDNYKLTKSKKALKAIAWLTLGNISYEPGDMLWHNIEFVHKFISEEELYAEFAAGGFEIVYLNFQKMWSGALLRKLDRKMETILERKS